MPEMIRFRIGNARRSGGNSIGNSVMTAPPLSAIRLARPMFSCGYNVAKPLPTTATVTPRDRSVASCATVSIPRASPETTGHPA